MDAVVTIVIIFRNHAARARRVPVSSETNERVARSVDVRIIINVVSRVLFQRQEYTHFAVETTLAASRGVGNPKTPRAAAKNRRLLAHAKRVFRRLF